MLKDPDRRVNGKGEKILKKKKWYSGCIWCSKKYNVKTLFWLYFK